MRKSTPLWYIERQITTFENSLEGILSKSYRRILVTEGIRRQRLELAI